MIKDEETQITMDTFKQLVGKTEKVSFSSGSDSGDRIRRSDLLRKRVPNRRGGVCERPLTIGYCTDRWTMEDRVVLDTRVNEESKVKGNVPTYFNVVLQHC